MTFLRFLRVAPFTILLASCSAGGGTGAADGDETGDEEVTGEGASTGSGATTGSNGGDDDGTRPAGTGAMVNGDSGGTTGDSGGSDPGGSGGTIDPGSGGSATTEACVPGGTGFDQQIDHVIDLATCVYYQRFASPGEHQASLPHADAIVSCEALSLAGFDDWRLPSVEELSAIVDTTVQLQPSTDPTLFPGTQNSMYWTSMTTAGKVTALDFYNSGFQNNNIGPDGAQAYRCVRKAP